MFFNRRNCGCQMERMCCEQQQPIMEPVINNCVEKEFYHEVQHCCPIHTHVVNKHIYNHTYTPQYTTSEENVIINNDCGKCSGFANR